MSDFEREVRFSVPHDHRDEDHKKGCRGMDIYFILRKVDGSGAITASVGTDWQRHPLKFPYNSFAKGPRERWDKPGLDAGRVADGREPYYFGPPNPQVVSLHMLEKDEAHDWWYGPDDCDVLPGGQCYGDHGYLVADDFLIALMEGGHEGAWAWLEECYESWTGPPDE